MGQLEVKTEDVAAGSSRRPSSLMNGHERGHNFARYFRDNIFREWFSDNRSEITLRLRGLEHAGIAPGDRVHVVMTEDQGFNWGPTTTAGRHVLQSATFAGSEADARETLTPEDLPTTTPTAGGGIWTVQSSQVNWTGCRVTIVCTRREEKSSSWPTDESIHHVHDGAGLAETVHED